MNWVHINRQKQHDFKTIMDNISARIEEIKLNYMNTIIKLFSLATEMKTIRKIYFHHEFEEYSPEMDLEKAQIATTIK